MFGIFVHGRFHDFRRRCSCNVRFGIRRTVLGRKSLFVFWGKSTPRSGVFRVYCSTLDSEAKSPTEAWQQTAALRATPELKKAVPKADSSETGGLEHSKGSTMNPMFHSCQSRLRVARHKHRETQTQTRRHTDTQTRRHARPLAHAYSHDARPASVRTHTHAHAHARTHTRTKMAGVTLQEWF